MKEKSESGSAGLYQYRNIARCLSDGVSFLTDNFVRFVRLTLPVGIPLAVAVAALLYLLCDVTLLRQNAMGSLIALAVLGLFIVMFTSAYVAVMHRLLMLCDEGTDLKRLPLRTLYSREFWQLTFRALVVGLLGWLLTGAFVFALHYIVGMQLDDELVTVASKSVGFGVVAILAIVLLTPYSLCTAGTLMGRDGLVSNFRQAYSLAWHRWSKVFSVALLSGLIVGIVSLLLFSPAIVTGLMQLNATQSIIQGDAVDIPSGFGVWVSIVFLLSAYIYTLLLWVQYIPLAYQYAAARSAYDEQLNQTKPLI